VSLIETEKLLAETIAAELKKLSYDGKFNPQVPILQTIKTVFFKFKKITT
jgi:hypothetical protein